MLEQQPWYLCLVFSVMFVFGCGSLPDDDYGDSPQPGSPTAQPDTPTSAPAEHPDDTPAVTPEPTPEPTPLGTPTSAPDIPPLGLQPTPLAEVVPASCPTEVIKQDVSAAWFDVYEDEFGDIVFMATLAYETDQVEPFVSEACHFSIHTTYISEPYYGGVNNWVQGIYLYPSPDSHSPAGQWELIFVVPSKAYYDHCNDDWEVCREDYYSQVYYPRL